MEETMNILEWRKSSASVTGNCVEVAELTQGAVLVRNSNHPGDGCVQFTNKEWECFVIGVKNGEFDYK
jgi:hypothetical protein